MKKALIFACLLAITFFVVCCFIPKEPPTLSDLDCNEYGMCKEGIAYTIKDETFIISKETCLQHNRKWREDLSACYMR